MDGKQATLSRRFIIIHFRNTHFDAQPTCFKMTSPGSEFPALLADATRVGLNLGSVNAPHREQCFNSSTYRFVLSRGLTKETNNLLLRRNLAVCFE